MLVLLAFGIIMNADSQSVGYNPITQSQFNTAISTTPVFSWSVNGNNGGGSIITTPNFTNVSAVITVVDHITTFTFGVSVNNTQLTVNPSLGGSVNFNIGPITLNTTATRAFIVAWCNMSAQNGSAESLSSLMINGIPISPTVIANSANRFSAIEIDSSNPITTISMVGTANAVSRTDETGFGIYYGTNPVPEPTPIILGIVGIAFIFLRRRFRSNRERLL